MYTHTHTHTRGRQLWEAKLSLGLVSHFPQGITQTELKHVCQLCVRRLWVTRDMEDAARSDVSVKGVTGLM
jgi:hypothetical protein